VDRRAGLSYGSRLKGLFATMAVIVTRTGHPAEPATLPHAQIRTNDRVTAWRAA
jgi:hypothetical protein